MSSDLSVKIINATKWSSLAEIIAKLINPISTMILARLLIPEVFGAIATVMLVISFAELFTDAGFQKYLIQYDYKTDKDLYESTNVAFLTNLFMSIFLWGFVIVFRDWIAEVLGNNKLGTAIAIAFFSVPLAAFSSIQIALFKRNFDFKTLFILRLTGLIIPLLITIPFAIILKNYWALIIGTLSLNLINATYLTIRSKWKPNFYYSLKCLKKMLSFSLWTILESVSVWFSSYVGILVIGLKLNNYFLGLYQTSTTVVVQILTIISMAIVPVLFSTLSRLQHNDIEFKRMFLYFQSIVALLVIPIGFGLFSYRHFVTRVLLGPQWYEAADFIGLLGLIISLTLVFSQLCSEVFRAKGNPKLSLILQLSFLLFFIPAITASIKYGFKTVCITSAVSRLIMIIVSSILMYKFYRISIFDMLKGTSVKIIAACFMFLFSLILQHISDSFYWIFSSIFICIFFYFGILFMINRERELLLKLGVLLKQAFISR